ncbi:MAG: MFS transporter [Anaerolineae bacterium]|nr:MFS transporter [Anaerolineae bacterium]
MAEVVTTGNSVNIASEDSLLSGKEKFSFFLVNMGNIPLMTLLGSFLLIFYTDVVGLDPAVIGTLFLVARILDGFNDPVMGYIVDHLPRTKMGRFRSYLILGTIITAIVYLLTWLGPSLAPTGKILFAFLGYLLFGFVFDLMDIPLNSMIAVMSDRDRDRTTLSNIKGFAYMFGGVLIYIVALPIVSLFTSEQAGYHWLILFFTVFVVLFSVLGTLGIRERVNPIKPEKYGLRDLYNILGNKAVLSHFVQQLFTMAGGGVIQGSILFFFIYVLDRPDYLALFGVSRAVGTVIALGLVPGLTRRYGKKLVNTIANLVTIIGFMVMFVLPAEQPVWFVIVMVLAAPGSGATSILMYSIQADNTDYVEWTQGVRAEGAVASLNSFIIKAGLGLGSGIGAYMLGVIGYVPNAVQSAETIRGLYSLNFLFPALISIAGVIVWILFYPITKEMNQLMAADLANKRIAPRDSSG